MRALLPIIWLSQAWLLTSSEAKSTANSAKCSLKKDELEAMLQPSNWPFPLPLPVDIDEIRGGLSYFYGDHVDWDGLLKYKVSNSSIVGFFKRNADEIVRELNKRVLERSKPPKEKYNHWVLFRPPNNVNDLWLTEVSLASDTILHFMDKINMILNGGILSTELNTHRLYEDQIKQLELLKDISKGIHYLQDLKTSPYFGMLMDKDQQKMVLTYVQKNGAQNVACLYDLMTMRNLTFYKTLMNAVPQDKLVRFLNDFVIEAINLINADGTQLNAQSVYKLGKAAVKRTDFDKISSDLFLVFLRARAVVLGVDVREIFEDLDEVHRMIGQAFHDMLEGDWPEMLDFISTLVKSTLSSRKFWLKIDSVYHDQILQTKETYEARQKSLNNWIKNDLRPSLKSVLEYMIMIRTKDSVLVEDTRAFLETLDIASYVQGPLSSLTRVVSKYYLSCYTALYGKPDFLQMQEMVENNSVAKLVKDVFTTDWPQNKPPPKRLVEFIEKFQDMVLLLMNSSWGTCESPNQI